MPILSIDISTLVFSVLFAGGFLFFIIVSIYLLSRSLGVRRSGIELLLESIESPAWLCDKSGNLIWSNASYIKSVSTTDFLLDSTTQKKIMSFHKSNSIPSTFHESLTLTISGERRLVDLYHISFIGGSIGLAIDVNESLEVKERINQILQGHGQTLNELNTAIASFDSSGVLTFHNRAFRDLWNLKESELNLDNSSLLDLLRTQDKLPERPDWSTWRTSILSIYRSNSIYEDLWHLPDSRTLRVVGTPQEHGGVTWLFEDISEELKLQSRVDTLSKVQGETLDRLKEGVAVFNSAGELTLFNPSFLSLWDFPKSGLPIGTSISHISAHCATLTIESDFWDTLVLGITSAPPERDSLNGRLTTHSGQRLDYFLQPLPDGQNLLIFSDVTIDQLKSNFLNHISSAFRRPLTTIIGFSQLMQSGTLREKQDEYLDDIVSSATTLSSMVNNILDLTTFDAGILELSLSPVTIKAPIENAITSLSQELKEKELNLDCPKITDTIILLADSNRLQQIFFNLLTSAISFSPQGGVIRLEFIDSPDYLIFTISDDGPSIPAENQSSIFDGFHSASVDSASEQSNDRGVGFTLALTRHLVNLHKGTIELDTSVTQGTRFQCSFPKFKGLEKP